jgi:hypothetical protein
MFCAFNAKSDPTAYSRSELVSVEHCQRMNWVEYFEILKRFVRDVAFSDYDVEVF